MYLRLVDYRQQIQSDNLNQIISATDSIRLSAELAAQSELKSYLVQKYNTDAEFTDTTVWSNSLAYKATNRVYLDATAFSAVTVYTTGQLILQSGNVYRSISGSAAHAFLVSEWTLLGVQYDMFYGAYPKPLYDYYITYVAGNQVFYKDKTYTAVLGSLGILPNDSIDGARYWGAGVAYSITAATMLTNATFWTAGDSRNQQMVMYYIDIALYITHSRISPRNIPEIRMDRYDSAIKWLKACATGNDITADLAKIQPIQGMRNRYGSQRKNVNNY